MRYIELIVTDVPDGVDPLTRTEWIHRDHIETIEPYTTEDHDELMLWLELTLTSGRVRYLPISPVQPDTIDALASTAIFELLELGGLPIRAAAHHSDGNPRRPAP